VNTTRRRFRGSFDLYRLSFMMLLEQAEYKESLLATKTSLEGLKDTLLSWPQDYKTEISPLRASIMELLRSMVDILDFEHKPREEVPERRDSVSADERQQDEECSDNSQVRY
jgi:hypothetical protein